jgi:hypothetical protein
LRTLAEFVAARLATNPRDAAGAYVFFGGGVAITPFSEGLEAFCFGGPAFFGLRSSRLPRCWPFGMV